MAKYKKGQAGAGSAALLVTVIAAMILLYTLFLPPEDRARLLDETNGLGTANDNSVNNILLKESPGRLDLIKKSTIEHKVSSFNLLSKTEGRLIKEFDGVYAERTIFTDKPQTLQFDIPDLDNTENVLLSFYSKEYKGRLIITINDKIISEKEYTSSLMEPIKIPKSSLSKTNTIKFSVSKPGIIFFVTNKYSLENIKIFADVTDKTALENNQGIFLTGVERQNLEKATLSLMPTCKTNEVGKISILINNQEIYSGMPDCTMPLKIDIAPGRLLEGENTLKITAEKGNYVIDQTKLTSYLKDSIFPTFYFNVDENTQKSVENGTYNVNMSVVFVASYDFQDVEVEINGRKFSIDNKKRTYTQTINPYIREENNAITLRPLDSTVDIVELKVFKYRINQTN